MKPTTYGLEGGLFPITGGNSLRVLCTNIVQNCFYYRNILLNKYVFSYTGFEESNQFPGVFPGNSISRNNRNYSIFENFVIYIL